MLLLLILHCCWAITIVFIVDAERELSCCYVISFHPASFRIVCRINGEWWVCVACLDPHSEALHDCGSRDELNFCIIHQTVRRRLLQVNNRIRVEYESEIAGWRGKNEGIIILRVSIFNWFGMRLIHSTSHEALSGDDGLNSRVSKIDFRSSNWCRSDDYREKRKAEQATQTI